ncbi:hypothetical protein KM043_004547 [Ampulex compressa]|nr:hypothetical protein KM043_004547 [Ampulex compressa]
MQVAIKPVNAMPSSPGRQDVSLMTGIILLVTRPTDEPRPGNRFCYCNTSITRPCLARAKYETMQGVIESLEKGEIFGTDREDHPSSRTRFSPRAREYCEGRIKDPPIL